jgi:hypothetical protein
MKIVLYTCNINNYDRRKPLMGADPNTQYLYYSDNMDRVEGWTMMSINNNVHEDPVKRCRFYKINSHLLPPHEFSIWVDSSFQVKDINVNDYIKTHLRKYDLSCYHHNTDDPRRSCLYKEAATCLLNGKGDPDVIMNQITRYRNEGYPINNDLYATGILIRRNNAKVKEFNEIWWNEVSNGSQRDQLSQMYAIWKTGIKSTKIVNSQVYNNELVKYFHHVHKAEELRNKARTKRIRKFKAG